MVSFEPDKIDVWLDDRRLHLEPGQTVVAHGIDRGLNADEVVEKELVDQKMAADRGKTGERRDELQAERLGTGSLQAPLASPRGTDEVARLGHTLEAMRQALVDRDRERVAVR